MDDESTYHPDMSHPYLSGVQLDIPTVRVLSGTLKGKEFQLTTEEYLIGRDPATDIVVDEKEVSRRHAMISKKAGEYLLCDLESTNGIYVNNLKLEKSILKHGDLFQIGTCIFQFIWDRRQYKR